MRIEKVLVPVDFSPPSGLAVNYGIALARKFRAKLSLLNVVEPATALIYSFPTEGAKLEKEQSKRAWRMLPALVGPEDADDLDLQILVKTGNIEEQIASAIRDERADIVVMGTHGRRLLGRWLIGSVTQHMLRKIDVPVLTVCRLTRPLTFARILFAADLSASSKEGFAFALDLARSTDANLSVMYVVEEVNLVYGGNEVAGYVGVRSLEEARETLDQFVAEGKRQKVRVETMVVEGVTAQAIFKAAEDTCADMIVLTVERKGLLERALLGSTAERVIREAHVPVLSIPAGAKAASEKTEETAERLQ
jgi:nucleotide-binding universal stress UspA family protein